MNSKTIVYVDGFNLYYGALKRTPYRWLNLEKLFGSVFPQNQICRIKYFSARVHPQPGDPDQQTRQLLYWRALQTVGIIDIIEGHYLSHEKSLPLANPTPGAKFAKVIVSEEKGSDVNLATHLLVDAFEDHFECAIVVSGDSDLATPIEMVQNKTGKKVGVFLPQLQQAGRQPRRAAKLQQVATFFRTNLRPGVLLASQFPDTLHDGQGTFNKPVTWQ